MMCRMCANTVSFQNGAWDGHKCSGFQPFLNWTFPRGDTSIFSKNVVKFCRTKWGGVVKGLKKTRYVGFVSERKICFLGRAQHLGFEKTNPEVILNP